SSTHRLRQAPRCGRPSTRATTRAPARCFRDRAARKLVSAASAWTKLFLLGVFFFLGFALLFVGTHLTFGHGSLSVASRCETCHDLRRVQPAFVLPAERGGCLSPHLVYASPQRDECCVDDGVGVEAG